MEGSRNYGRFIVLGHSRTGSNYLRGLLNSHGGAVAFGELFREPPSSLKTPNPAGLEPALDPLRFFEAQFFGDVPPSIRALGFKIFYYHAQKPPWNVIWGYLQDQRDIRVIHLKRRNYLRTQLSRVRAFQTGRWFSISAEQDPGPPVELDYAACCKRFTKIRDWESSHDRLFRNHPLLQVTYEELAGDTEREMERVQEFLDLEKRTLIPCTRRQNHLPLAQAIANYHELKARFANSEWQRFFEE